MEVIPYNKKSQPLMVTVEGEVGVYVITPDEIISMCQKKKHPKKVKGKRSKTQGATFSRIISTHGKALITGKYPTGAVVTPTMAAKLKNTLVKAARRIEDGSSISPNALTTLNSLDVAGFSYLVGEIREALLK